MIASTDVAIILYDDCKRLFGLDTYLGGTEPKGEIKTERIIVRAKRQTPGKIWKKNYADINICVPNESNGEPRQVRLQELERQALLFFEDEVVGEYDGTTYQYVYDSIGIEKDTSLLCHYVNVRVLFEVLDAASLSNSNNRP